MTNCGITMAFPWSSDGMTPYPASAQPALEQLLKELIRFDDDDATVRAQGVPRGAPLWDPTGARSDAHSIFMAVRQNVAALRRFRDLAELRYREGASIYLEVANAEQSLFNAELAYVATQAQLFQSYANLYRAMGDGWIEEAERLTSGGNER